MDIARIIVVDDHIIFRKGLQTILNEIDIVKVVGEASNGNELLNLLKKQETDIIFMDMLMPEMDGLQAIAEIRKLGNEVPVVAVTAVENPDTRSAAEALGVEDYLLKPATTDQLKDILLRTFPKNAPGD